MHNKVLAIILYYNWKYWWQFNLVAQDGITIICTIYTQEPIMIIRKRREREARIAHAVEPPITDLLRYGLPLYNGQRTCPN